MPVTKAIGLMSGTSMDGVDVALIETDGIAEIRFGPEGFEPYGDADRALLRAALVEASTLEDRTARPAILASAEQMVTGRHAAAVEAFLARNAIARESIGLVGFHGQTVLHRPKDHLTVQIGDGQALADLLGLTLVYDFRSADVVAGGQGAPIATVYHRALVEAAGMVGPVALLNIGGVANVTFIAAAADPIACDTGPGNALLDDLMLSHTGQPIDHDGTAASAGHCDPAALAALLDHPYFDLPPPKSLDRNAFSRTQVEHLATADAAATLTAFTAASVARLLPLLPQTPRLVVVCGGGARNPVLMRELGRRLPCAVTTATACGWSADAMEAQAFAYLAVRSAAGLPLTFPTTTGVAQAISGGVIARPFGA